MLPKKSDLEKIPHTRVNAVYFTERFLTQEDVKGKIVVDVSAGTGFVANMWHERGAQVEAYDLHPELLSYLPITCKPIDLSKPFPIADAYADYVLCMETIESIADHYFLLNELSRILKPGGTLIVTMPNMSNLQSRVAYFLMESERGRTFLPNEYNGIVSYDEDHAYLGRFFLCGVQRLRNLAALAGLNWKRAYPNAISGTSLLFFVLTAPFIYLRSWLTLQRALRKENRAEAKAALQEQFNLNTSPLLLLHKHLCVTLEKK